MNRFGRVTRTLTGFMALLMATLISGCGGGSGGGSPILGGGGGALTPTVTAAVPVAGAVGVPTTTKAISATFSKAMNPATLTAASFTLECPLGAPRAGGTVNYVAASNTAILTLPAAAPNLPVGLCTATVTTAARDTTGIALASNYVWTFTTVALVDKIRPTVLNTFPTTGAIIPPATIPAPTPAVPTNTAITATFSKDMTPATVTAAGTFTLTCAAPCVSPVGSVVTYVPGSRTATYTPPGALTPATTYPATITLAATDTAAPANALAGNQAPLGGPSNYVWTFTTAAGPALPGNVTVLSTKPVNAAAGVCPNAAVNATFTIPSGLRMDPATVNAATFTVTAPGPVPVAAASVTLDAATGTIATFTPAAALTPGVLYTATITGGAAGVKDLAIPANTMLANSTWTFTAGPATGACLAPVALGSAAPFGNLGGTAGTTNQGIKTIINGGIASTATATSAVTGFHDTAGDIYTETPLNIGTVNGLIYTCTVSTLGPTSAAVNPASCTIATQARQDAQAAYLSLAALPPGPDPGAGQLGGLTLAPGVYTAAAGSFQITGGVDLTLDAQGDANAVWVFQMATTLTVGAAGAPRSVILINGAQAKNVFWQVGTSATINGAGGGTMVGNIIASSAVSFSTAGNAAITTLNGRATGLNASVTMTNTVINVPAP